MRIEALLLSVSLLATGCASLHPPASRDLPMSDTARTATGHAFAQAPSEEPPGGLASPPSSTPRSEASARRSHRRASREDTTDVGRGHAVGTVGGERLHGPLTRQAVRESMEHVKRATGSVASALHGLASRKAGIGGANGAFTRYVTHGIHQLRWLDGALGGALTLTDTAASVGDADMELGILRMTGPRLQAAMFGAMLLSAWLDFLTLADVTLQQCPAYSAERLFMDLRRVQALTEPTMTALASLDPRSVEAAAAAMPDLMGQLTREYGSIRQGARTAMERSGQLMAAAQLMEALTLASVLKMSLPRLPPAAPATLGMGLVMGSGGVMVGSRIVISAEWVERMRRLVQAGVISVPVASAAVRIQAGQVLMAQAHGDLPKGVREALGDAPEVRAMHETGRAGAGMAEPPKHHVLPREHREWFEQRGFTGDLNIDQFCVRLEAAHHQAIHGGGNWRLGRTWPQEWNQMIMNALREAELDAGRMLTRNQVLSIVAERMKFYDIPMNFTSGKRR